MIHLDKGKLISKVAVKNDNLGFIEQCKSDNRILLMYVIKNDLVEVTTKKLLAELALICAGNRDLCSVTKTYMNNLIKYGQSKKLLLYLMDKKSFKLKRLRKPLRTKYARRTNRVR